MSQSRQFLTDSAADNSAVAELIEAWSRQLQAGKPSDVEAFLARHPRYADRLRLLLPAVQVLAELGQSAAKEISFPPRDPGSETASGVLGDYRIVREVGRGGMGVVYEAEQLSLGRRVALKVLPLAATMDPRQLQRFANEARAAASLDHPHIVKVHAVSQERGVHYYAMQFIDGQTLADYVCQQRPLADHTPTPPSQPPASADATQVYRPGNDQAAPAAADSTAAARQSTQKSSVRDRAYFRNVARLGIQAAGGLEHAHALGIVHRDIKPANLMLDEKGDLWITDFGLARTAADSGLTLTGDLLGTLRYMSPEQALAQHGLVDHRTDIYALGATLYELLTLRPAIDGKDRREILHRIAFEEPATPRKLDRAIPAELETIVLKALAKNPAERYTTAKELADDLQRFLNDEPIRARRPTWRQRARRFARRHRALVAGIAASAVVALVALTAGGAWYYVQQVEAQAEADWRQFQAEQDFDAALAKASGHRDDLHRQLAERGGVFKLLNNPSGWQTQIEQAKTALGQAEAVAARADSPIAEDHLGMMQELAALLQKDQAERQLALVLESFRLKRFPIPEGSLDEGMFDYVGASRQYRDAFKGVGLDVLDGKVGEVATHIRQFAIKEQLVAALDDWAFAIAKSVPDPEERRKMWKRLLDVARQADPGPWTDQLRNPHLWTDPVALQNLVAKMPMAQLSPQMLVVVGGMLRQNNLDAVPWLRKAKYLYPADFWINLSLGNAVPLSEAAEAAGYYHAALAIRENSIAYHNLGVVLAHQGKQAEAELAYRKAIGLEKDYAGAHCSLGNALYKQNKFSDAETHLLQATKLNPDFAMAYGILGLTCVEQNRPQEAESHYRTAIELYERDMALRSEALKKAAALGKDKAIAYQKDMIFKLQQELSQTYYNLGNALGKQKKLAQAEAALRQAIHWNPEDASAYCNLGNALLEQDRPAEAELAYCRAAQLKKGFASAHYGEGVCLLSQKKFAEAEAALVKAAEARPGHAETYRKLATALTEQGKHGPAEASLRKLIQLRPDDFYPHNHLGINLGMQNKFAEAEAIFRKAVALKPSIAAAHNNLGNALRYQGKWAEAEAAYLEAVKLKPDSADMQFNLGFALMSQNKHAAAEEAFRKAVLLQPKHAQAQNNLGAALLEQNKLVEAEKAFRQAILLDSKYPIPRIGLGKALVEQGRFSEAAVAYQQGLALMTPSHPSHGSSQGHFQECQQLLALEAKLPAALQGRQTGPDDLLALADLCRRFKKNYPDAVKLYSAAFAAKSDLPRDQTLLHQDHAAGAAALAAAGKGMGADKLDAKEKATLRQQALTWLKASLKLRSQQIQQGTAQDVQAATKALAHWQTDPDLASVRAKEALAALAKEEQQAWQQLWSEVGQLVKQGQAKSKQPDTPTTPKVDP